MWLCLCLCACVCAALRCRCPCSACCECFACFARFDGAFTTCVAGGARLDRAHDACCVPRRLHTRVLAAAAASLRSWAALAERAAASGGAERQAGQLLHPGGCLAGWVAGWVSRCRWLAGRSSSSSRCRRVLQELPSHLGGGWPGVDGPGVDWVRVLALRRQCQRATCVACGLRVPACVLAPLPVSLTIVPHSGRQTFILFTSTPCKQH